MNSKGLLFGNKQPVSIQDAIDAENEKLMFEMFASWPRLPHAMVFAKEEVLSRRLKMKQLGESFVFTNETHDYQCWTNKQGQLHRLDGPAIIEKGDKMWYVVDVLHRTDGPAVEWSDGSFEWHFQGKLHRVDGPAYKNPQAEKWYLNGNLHRDNGPAACYDSGRKEFYKHGKKIHRYP